jgi:porin
MQKAVSLGFGYQRVPGQDLLGLGYSWGQPNSDTFGRGLRDQSTVELFYRLMVAQRLAITPTVQLLINPAQNRQDDRIWVFGLRARLAL